MHSASRPAMPRPFASILLVALAVSASLGTLACNKPSPTPDTTAGTPDDGKSPPDDPPVTRKLAVPADHPLHARYEGTSFENDCTADADCQLGGCSSEVCSAEEGVITTCDVPPVALPEGSACGCVADQCQWWNESGDTLPPGDTPPGVDCGGEPCSPPNECIEYYGIAGPSGPKFYACAIRCTLPKRACPEGMKCVTIADGPGEVCQPEEPQPQ